jgi:hypothetical protein
MSSRSPRSRAASSAPRMRVPACGVVATVSEMNAIVCVIPVRRLTETLFGRYCRSCAACSTRRSTSGEMRISRLRPASTNDAAVWETPATRATSAWVARRAVIPDALDRSPAACAQG